MPIKIDYTPVGALGGAAILAGQGQYKRWLDEMQQRWNMQQSGIAAQQQAQADRLAFEQADRERQREWQTARDMWQARNEDYRAGRDYDWRRGDRESDQEFRWNMAGEQENWRSAEADKERAWRKAEFDRKARMEAAGAYFPDQTQPEGEGWIPDDPEPEWVYSPQDQKRVDEIYRRKATIESSKDLDDTEKAVGIKQLSDELSKIKQIRREPTAQEMLQKNVVQDEQGNTYVFNPKTGLMRRYGEDDKAKAEIEKQIAATTERLWRDDLKRDSAERRYRTMQDARREARSLFIDEPAEPQTSADADGSVLVAGGTPPERLMAIAKEAYGERQFAFMPMPDGSTKIVPMGQPAARQAESQQTQQQAQSAPTGPRGNDPLNIMAHQLREAAASGDIARWRQIKADIDRAIAQRKAQQAAISGENQMVYAH